ncbi:MAG: pyridoxal phosphate-dependent aminotransferase [Candidatus Hodarchaeales archaeon]
MVNYKILEDMGAGIFEVLARAKNLERQGKEILHFEIGQPDFHTPEHVKEATKRALDENFTGYVPAGGILELKEAIQDEVEKTRGFRPSLKQILVVPGGNSAIYYALRSIIDFIEEEVIYPNPGFPTYGSVVNYLGCKDVAIPLKEENEFRFNPGDIKANITDKTKVVILNSPQNPTGAVMKKEEITRVAELSEQHGFFIFTDEIYSKMTYDEKHFSASVFDECKERTVLLDGFSKSYSMTGFRLGWMIAPEWVIRRAELLISIGISCTSGFIQKGGIAALKGPQDDLYSNMEKFRKRRDTIVKGLNEIPGFSCVMPQGAFYAFPNITKTGMNSKDCADHILQHGVACLPGTIFGSGGEGFLRFSYATSVDNIKKAIDKLKEAF